MSKTKQQYQKEIKICPVCKREFHNRAKWDKRGQWEQIKYCSKKCRKKATYKVSSSK